MKIANFIPTRTSKQKEDADNVLYVPSDRRMSLAYQNMGDLSPLLVKNMSNWVEFLDLSYNKLRDVRFLSRMSGLHTLILDHNLVVSTSVFPKLPNLRVLWLNFNLIANVDLFIPELSHRCPNLEVLSLMGNVAARSFINGATPEQQAEYRCFVIGHFENLRYLDDQPVSPLERLHSQKPAQKNLLEDFMIIVRGVKDSYMMTNRRSNQIV